ncbi:MAG: lipopolysaccharide heptosyltransferase II [Elusimicrobia bacterium]|jgi:heptosyltransferase-2|nr:lipopolysaccharide heptosyltransferase II [Elusimicrobiota bacterium]
MRHLKDTVIIQTAYLGDCVLTLPLAKTLKECSDIGNVTVVCRPEVKAVFRFSSSVDKIIVYDKKGKDKGLAGALRIIKKLKSKKFDTAFLPQRSFRSGLMAFLSRIPERIGFNRGGAAFFLTSKCKYNWKKHEVERLLDIAGLAGCVNKKRSFDLLPASLPAQNLSLKYREIFNKGDKKKIVGIAPQSKWPTKCWPEERYKELAKSIKEKAKVVIFGVEKEEWPEGVINLTAGTSVKELIAAINEIDILVSNDSGIMHIAAALGKPVIVIYGATVPDLGFTPYGNESVIIQTELECRPCGLHGPKKCRLGHFKCMKNIKTSTVREALYEKIRA